jgi:hypothetical protein
MVTPCGQLTLVHSSVASVASVCSRFNIVCGYKTMCEPEICVMDAKIGSDHACQHRKWSVTPWAFHLSCCFCRDNAFRTFKNPQACSEAGVAPELPASASWRSQNLRRKAHRELTSGNAGLADPFSTSTRRVRLVCARVRCERTPKSGPIQPPRMGGKFEVVPDLTNSV